MTLDELLQSEEGLRLTPYDDATGKELKPGDTIQGKISIGIGCNLQAGLSKEEVMFLYRNRRDKAKDALKDRFPFSEFLSPVRKIVLQAMAFQMGINGLASFKNMLEAAQRFDYNRAAEEMLNSRWAQQTPERAKRMAEMMRTGQAS